MYEGASRNSPALVERVLVIFDGQCLLCDGSVRFLLRHDRSRRYDFATTSSEAGSRWLRSSGLDPSDPASFLLVEGNRVSQASDAVLRVLTGLGGGWRLFGALRLVPRPLRDALYRLIARNRHRWFGRSEQCMIPDPEVRPRFLD